MSGDPRSTGNEDADPPRDYLGRILIAFIVAAGIFWALSFMF